MNLNKLKQLSSIFENIFIITLIFSLVFISSCKKAIPNEQDGVKNTAKSLDKTLDLKSMNNYANLAPSLEPFEDIPAMDIQNLTEVQAENLLEPMVNTGALLYNDLISQLIATPEWAALTPAEQFAIVNFTPQQKAMLELLFSSASQDAGSGTPRWVNCGIAALGFHQAYTLFARAFTVGMSATTAIQVLKFVGLKYLGYIALAVAVYEFVQCINGDDSPTMPNGTLNPLDRESYLLPTPLPSIIAHVSSSEDITNSITEPSWNAIFVFFNSIDNKYYSNNSFSSFVPDGYYKSPEVTVPQEYYHIVNGESIMAYTVIF